MSDNQPEFIDDELTFADFIRVLRTFQDALARTTERLSLHEDSVGLVAMPILGALQIPTEENFAEVPGDDYDSHLQGVIDLFDRMPKKKTILAQSIVDGIQEAQHHLTADHDSEDAEPNESISYVAAIEHEACLTAMNEIASEIFKSLGHRYTAHYNAQLPSPLSRGGYEK